jgi:hypothetical protein
MSPTTHGPCQASRVHAAVFRSRYSIGKLLHHEIDRYADPGRDAFGLKQFLSAESAELIAWQKKLASEQIRLRWKTRLGDEWRRRRVPRTECRLRSERPPIRQVAPALPRLLRAPELTASRCQAGLADPPYMALVFSVTRAICFSRFARRRTATRFSSSLEPRNRAGRRMRRFA